MPLSAFYHIVSHVDGSYSLQEEGQNIKLFSFDEDVGLLLNHRCRPLMHPIALFAGLISRTFLANEQYFSLTINQPMVLSAMAYQPSE